MVIDQTVNFALINFVIRIEKKEKYIFKKRRETDLIFKLNCITRRRIHRAPKGKSKSSSTIDILGVCIETYRKKIEFQMTSDMTSNNIEIDHVKPICTFDMSNNGEKKEAFNWKKNTTTSQTRSSL